MSRSISQTRTLEGPSADEVEAYLKSHPTFFEDHLELLEQLRVPHPCGEAVSLVSRQLDLLRDKVRRLSRQMDDLVQIARENDALHQRVHQLGLTLIDSKSVEDVLAGLDWALHQYFQADFAEVRLLDAKFSTPIGNLLLGTSDVGFPVLNALVEESKPLCGPAQLELTQILFGEHAEAVASMAILPLKHAGVHGVLAIGSRDQNRFRSDMGLSFLIQMSEVLAARIASLLAGAELGVE
jgi:hypothetical protein